MQGAKRHALIALSLLASGSSCERRAATASSEGYAPERRPSVESTIGADPSSPAPTRNRASPATSASDAASPSDGPATSTAPLEPLTGSWLERLELPGGGWAFVAPPIGAREPRPVVIGVHGAGDRPEWSCGGWRLAMHAAAFVLCPQGSSTGNGRFAWSGSRAIASGIELGLAALREKYGAYVAAAPPLYAGFSQGASLARPVLRAGPVPFSGVVLAEGAYDTLADPSFPSELRARGTTHVLLVCGNPGCFERARRAELALRKAGLHAIAAGDPRAGHNLNREMQVALQAAWPAFVEGLPGWAASGLLRAR